MKYQGSLVNKWAGQPPPDMLQLDSFVNIKAAWSTSTGLWAPCCTR